MNSMNSMNSIKITETAVIIEQFVKNARNILESEWKDYAIKNPNLIASLVQAQTQVYIALQNISQE